MPHTANGPCELLLIRSSITHLAMVVTSHFAFRTFCIVRQFAQQSKVVPTKSTLYSIYEYYKTPK